MSDTPRGAAAERRRFCATLDRMFASARPLRATAPRRLTAALGLGLALSLTVAACGGDDDEPTAESTTTPAQSPATAGAVMLNGMWPLTGETLEGSLPDHPVYAVKIDNSSSSAPQVGLGSADMIVEELVEGGITRLAVFYYQDIPKTVGPVRSARASDIGIVKPVNATLVASGGARPTIRRLDASHIHTVTDGATGFYRETSRYAPYNLFMSLDKLAGEPDKGWKPPTRTYFEFGSADDFAGQIPVTRMDAVFSGGHTTEWAYSDKGWTRPNSYATAGDDFVADNVVLLEVKVGDAGYLDPAGNPVPETDFSGTGKGYLVHGDHAVKVTWRKGLKQSQLRLTADGEEITVPAGHTWIELVPADSGSISLHQ
jgi:hypothetical protein